MLLNAPNKPLEINRAASKDAQIDTLDQNIASLWGKVERLSNPSTSSILANHPVSRLQHDRLVYSNNKGELSSVTKLGNWIQGTKGQIIVKDIGGGRVKLSLPGTLSAALTVPSITVTSLTPTRLVATDAASTLVSVGNLTAWVAGTANQVNVANDGDGTITLSTPQNIHTAATPLFGGMTLNGNLSINTGNEVRLYNPAGTFYTGFEAPALAGNQIYVMPLADGAANTFLQTNGAGTLTWAAVAPGGANTNVQYNNAGAFGGNANFTYDGAGTVYASTAFNVGGAAGVYQINSVKVLDTVGTNNVRVGATGNTTTGYSSVFIGTNVCNSQALGTTYENVLIGHGVANNTNIAFYKCVMIGGDNATSALYSGKRNILIGWRAGRNLQGNSDGNVFVGENAGTTLQNGDNNFALGYNALGGGTAFNACVAIGQSALANANNNDIIGIGLDAGKSASAGKQSVYIGSYAGTDTSTQRNTFIGYKVGFKHVGGQNNNFYGYQTAYGAAAHTIYRNVVMGDEAFYNAATGGDDNLIAGYRAHYSNSTTDSVMLGPYAGYNNATSSRLIIDNQDRGAAANEVLNSLIHGDFNAASSSQALRLNTNTQIKHALYGTPDEITATNAGVAASLTTINTEVTTNGDGDLDDVTLANGTSGQIKNIYCVAVGNVADSYKITPTNMVGGTQITFAASPIGLGCTLVYADNEGWVVVGNNGGVIT